MLCAVNAPQPCRSRETMAGRFRTERSQLRTVGAASLKPAFASTSTATRSEWGLASRTTKAQPPAEPTRSNAIEGTKEEKPLRKSPSDSSARKRKDKRHLRERRHGTGVVILPGGDKVWYSSCCLVRFCLVKPAQRLSQCLDNETAKSAMILLCRCGLVYKLELCVQTV